MSKKLANTSKNTNPVVFFRPLESTKRASKPINNTNRILSSTASSCNKSNKISKPTALTTKSNKFQTISLASTNKNQADYVNANLNNYHNLSISDQSNNDAIQSQSMCDIETRFQTQKSNLTSSTSSLLQQSVLAQQNSIHLNNTLHLLLHVMQIQNQIYQQTMQFLTNMLMLIQASSNTQTNPVNSNDASQTSSIEVRVATTQANVSDEDAVELSLLVDVAEIESRVFTSDPVSKSKLSYFWSGIVIRWEATRLKALVEPYSATICSLVGYVLTLNRDIRLMDRKFQIGI
jgi:hypothetical protein